MKNVRIVKITLFLLAAACIVPFEAVASNARSYQRACPMNLPQQTVNGVLQVGQVEHIRQWSGTCTGALSASTGGGVLHLQVKEGDRWLDVGQGISINVPYLQPGTYRLVVRNQSAIRINYTAHFRFGIG